MCRWMGSHLHDWVDYQGVAVSVEKGRTFSAFRARQFFIFALLKVKRKCP